MDDSKDSEINDIQEKLNEIHRDIRTFIEDSNRQHLESILAFVRSDYSNVLENHLKKDIETGLAKNMVKKCDRLEECRANFTATLNQSASLIKKSSVDEKLIDTKRSDFKDLRATMPYKKCDICFAEASDLFEKQVILMKSLKIYETKTDQKQAISLIPSQSAIEDVLEPCCHTKRFEILKAVSCQSMSFSSLSQLTGLRGGNLLFHLQKLTDSGMIIQKHERGDYIITGKGFRVMEGINDIYCSLFNEH
ncbi:putative transcriptional regulator [Methanohalophilus levihalophilus]|uniref:winged helix-turn-helix domain-containing protein n=1 Tax=Methanohalophilus levihalophilus TaxID=1431282 RepID=UPI001AE7246A|nr:winged helix-turn-helix domain-containing protein [Methanohalophilus levihalophilus]MBP2029645.1 putative transcriptional regulator [Methanohalophilus levihalophilus]